MLLPRGIYTPLPCFFDEQEDVDYDAFKKHVQYTAKAGTIPVVSGTAGEAPHLSHDERKQLIRAAREALAEIELVGVPVVAGVGAPSTRESILLAQEAAAAGAAFVLAMTPGFYAANMLSNMGAVKQFFVDLAAGSPIPVIMYNFPVMSGGVNMDSDLIVEIAKAAPNVCGIKLTCADVGKLNRITAQVHDSAFRSSYPRSLGDGQPFEVIDGFIDFLLPSMACGSAGAISGLANVAPKACVKLWQLCQQLQDADTYKQAQDLQNLIALADGVQLKIGIPGMKKLLHRLFGYGEKPRRPLMPMSDEQADVVFCHRYLNELLALEKTLP